MFKLTFIELLLIFMHTIGKPNTKSLTQVGVSEHSLHIQNSEKNHQSRNK